MSGYFGTPQRQTAPTQVRVARILLYVVAGGTLLLFTFAFLATDTPREAGAIAGVPILLGAAGLVLGLLVKPGRVAVRIGIIVLEACWLLVAVSRLAQGDVTGVVTMVLPIVLLVLVNAKPARTYFRRDQG